MRFDQRRAGAAATITAGTRTKVLDGWQITVTGSSAATCQQVTAGLPTSAVSKYGAKIVGAASVSAVDYGQRIEARDTTQWGGYVSLRVGWIYVDGAAGTITPSLRIDTPAAADDWTTPTNRLAQAFTAAAGGFFTHTFDLSALTNYANGAQVYIRFSGASDLDANTKSVVITDWDITPGQAANRQFQLEDYQVEYDRVRRYYQKTFNAATAPAQNAGLAGSLVMTGDDSNTTAFQWQHSPPMRTTPTITTYNPSAAATTPVNGSDGSSGTLSTVQGGEQVTYIRFDASGATRETDYHIHAAADAEL